MFSDKILRKQLAPLWKLYYPAAADYTQQDGDDSNNQQNVNQDVTLHTSS